MSLAIRGEAAEVALAETQAVLAHVRHPERRGTLADLAAAIGDGRLGDDDAQALEVVLEQGLAAGRIRGLYGPEGEQATLTTYRRLPAGRALADSARAVSDTLTMLAGRTLEHVRIQATAPGSYLVTVAVDGLELAVRLDRTGARLHTAAV